MFQFILGLSFGWFFFSKKSNESGVYFVCKITDEELFNECFPDPQNKSESKVQAHWDYCPYKKIIKIKIEDFKFNKEMSFDEFMLTTSIEHTFFQEFGDIFIHFEYYIDNKKYTNVFDYNEIKITIDKIPFNFNKNI